jgi:hypothetical protein
MTATFETTYEIPTRRQRSFRAALRHADADFTTFRRWGRFFLTYYTVETTAAEHAYLKRVAHELR